ncbi:MAG: TetR/AcrR family transcriptional regulator [Candidatus Izemoplasma sp.]|nr:TetR/AcrR family transcriptional regulator [Candidatus Izemoplasma sp.]
MNRRQEIINALLDMIKEEGLNVNFTMSELAKKVDIGKSTLYEYFSTKEDIIQAAITQLFDHMVDMIYAQPLDDNADFETLFKAQLRFMFQLNDQKKYIMRYIQMEYEHSFPKLIQPSMIQKMKQLRDFYEKRFTEIIQKGITEGVIPDTLDESKRFMIQSVVSGSIMRYSNVEIDHTLSLEDTIDTIYETLLRIVNN